MGQYSKIPYVIVIIADFNFGEGVNNLGHYF